MTTVIVEEEGQAYDFREAFQIFSEEIKHSLTVEQLGASVFQTAMKLFPVERIGFFTIPPGQHRLRLVAHSGYELLEHRGVPFEFERLRSSLRAPVAPEGMAAPDARVERGDAAVFRRWGMAVAFPLLDPGLEVLGFLVLGRKLSGRAFTCEEIDLLRLVADQTALATARINFQQQLLVRYAEAERLEELSRIKSDFVSSVSHELKTPLTSIKMMAELLHDNPAMAQEKIEMYADVIEGEADRLTRLINNILDFSKIERGVKEYAMAAVDLNAVVRRVMDIMRYPLAMESFSAALSTVESPLMIRADRDAVCGAIINLVSNAMKYSAGERTIGISTFLNEVAAGVSVRDRGIGIVPEERELIFEPFYRSKLRNIASVSGAGLGLTLVKHCMEAHGGRIDLESAPGSGTRVTLSFPRASGEEEGAAP